MSLRESALQPVPCVVLDNNTVLDWLLFRDPAGLAVGAALARSEMRWTGSAEMRAELDHVLGRGELARWQPDSAAIWAEWTRHCTEVPAPPVTLGALRFRCSDPDDQKFIDLAVSQQARWLLTRDRAVLKLARRLREEAGVSVLTPSAWLATRAATPAAAAKD